MEKLSHILPASSRVKSVDLAEAHPVRPGAPNFGGPVGTTASMRDRIKFSSLAREAAEEQEKSMQKSMPREERNAQIAKALSDKFFDTRLNNNTLSEQMSEQVAATTKPAVMPIANPPAEPRDSSHPFDKYA